MPKVYVRWYGDVLEGELLNGEYMGMKQVVISLDGHKPTALFHPNNVYQTAAEAASKEFDPVSVKKKSFSMVVTPSTETPSGDYFQQQYISAKEIISDAMPVYNMDMIEAFKRNNWNHERNHLRIDKLEKFYQLWRANVAPVTLLSHKKEPISTEAVPQNETPKQLQQSHKTVTQLSLFD